MSQWHIDIGPDRWDVVASLMGIADGTRSVGFAVRRRSRHRRLSPHGETVRIRIESLHREGAKVLRFTGVLAMRGHPFRLRQCSLPVSGRLLADSTGELTIEE